MCGIAGLVGELDSESERAVRAMTDAQTHRGPDDSGLYRSPGTPGVAFGFRRLAIIDLSADGHQPMVDEERGNVVVFNGEIYNFVELRKELEALGEVFRSKSDTEVLLRGYARWGADVVRRLRGMFAFAIYDRERRVVFLARDRLGIKPLYYAEGLGKGGKLFAFASELRALIASGLVERDLNPTAVSTYFWNGFVVGPHTLLKRVSLLDPGTSLMLPLDSPRARPSRYWSLGPRVPEAPERAREELEHELRTAVRQHLVSDVPLGVFLSGGVDSSAVAAMAVAAGTRGVKTFHIGFDESGFDESGYARRVAESLGTEHVEFRLTQERFRSGLEQALAGLDQPTFDAINTYFVSRVVREAGFTVALAGTGGDELFGGYSSFRDVPRGRLAARALRFVPESVLDGASSLAARTLGSADRAPPQTRWAKLGDLLVTRGDRVGLYQVAHALFTRDFLRELVGSSVFDATHSGLPKERARELAAMCSNGSDLAAVSTIELALFIGERLLRDSDAASMAVSLELRVPLLDHRVVEAAQMVPDAERFMPLGKKELLKAVGMPNLDRRIFDRPKAGFVLPIDVWAKDKLAGEIEATFADRALVEGLGFHFEALARLWRAFRSGARGMYWSRVWAPYVLLDWCRRHGVRLG